MASRYDIIRKKTMIPKLFSDTTVRNWNLNDRAIIEELETTRLRNNRQQRKVHARDKSMRARARGTKAKEPTGVNGMRAEMNCDHARWRSVHDSTSYGLRTHCSHRAYNRKQSAECLDERETPGAIHGSAVNPSEVPAGKHAPALSAHILHSTSVHDPCGLNRMLSTVDQ
jgi:hypothetical protein